MRRSRDRIAEKAMERNAPCPCGSGKKYKKCCLAKDEAARATPEARGEARDGGLSREARQELREDVDRLDEWANGARDALDAGRFEEVERLCALLEKDYPDLFDAYEIHARMREAQGSWKLDGGGRELRTGAEGSGGAGPGGVRRRAGARHARRPGPSAATGAEQRTGGNLVRNRTTGM